MWVEVELAVRERTRGHTQAICMERRIKCRVKKDEKSYLDVGEEGEGRDVGKLHREGRE